jgi:hypothetical protein
VLAAVRVATLPGLVRARRREMIDHALSAETLSQGLRAHLSGSAIAIQIFVPDERGSESIRRAARVNGIARSCERVAIVADHRIVPLRHVNPALMPFAERSVVHRVSGTDGEEGGCRDSHRSHDRASHAAPGARAAASDDSSSSAPPK